jgi:hypothetical protein
MTPACLRLSHATTRKSSLSTSVAFLVAGICGQMTSIPPRRDRVG